MKQISNILSAVAVCMALSLLGVVFFPASVAADANTGSDEALLATPSLSIPDGVAAIPGDKVSLPVTFAADGTNIASVVFSIDFDESCFSFDPSDNNGDGLPDDVIFDVPPAFNASATYDPADTDGEIDIFIADTFPPLATLPDSNIATILLTVSCTPAISPAKVDVLFSADPAASFGSNTGASIVGTTDDGSVDVTVCYALTTAVNPAGSGSVAADPAPNCGPDYHAGTAVTLTATSNTGFGFVDWSGDASGSSTATSITMDGAKSVTANFGACFSLTTTVVPTGSGSVAANPAPNCGSGKYVDGTDVTLTATANTGFNFVDWSGDASGANASTTISMNADKSATANFEAVCYTLDTNVAPAASGSVSASPADCSGGRYLEGTVVTLTATPATGFEFGSWSGDASGANATTTVTMNADKSVTANFDVACYSLATAVNPAGGGSVAASPASNCSGGKYLHNTVVTLTATASSDFAFSSWSGAASGSNAVTNITMDGNKSATANFSACYALATAVNPAGSGTVAASPAAGTCSNGKYVDGTSVTLTATANVGFGFASWSGDASGTDATTTITMDADKSVTADFGTCYALATDVNPAGSGTVAVSPTANCDNGDYVDGTVVTLTATPNTGFEFGSWSGDASGTDATTTITMDANKSATANFDIACYSLTDIIDPVGSGTVDISPASNCAGGEYLHNTVVTLTATANADFAFISWSGDASGSNAVTNITMDGDKSATANFSACYALATAVNPAGSGTVAASPAAGSCVNGEYVEGTSVTLTATASPDFAFISWAGDASGTDATTTITMDADKSVTADFSACYALTTVVDPTGSGTVAVSPAAGSCDGGEYVDGTAVTLTATPNTGFEFGSWSGDASGTNATTSITMDADKSASANFDVACYSLTLAVSPADSGTAAVSPAPNCAGGEYLHNTVVTLTATANADFAFISWSGDASGSNAVTNITMDGDKSATANFGACYALATAVDPADSGAVAASPAAGSCDSGEYVDGTTVTLTATANAGFGFVDWSGDASGTDAVTSITMDGDKSVTANLDVCYSLSTAVVPDGTGSVAADPAPNCAGDLYINGTDVTLTATANVDFAFFEWSGDVTGTNISITVSMDSNKSVTANFRLKVDPQTSWEIYLPFSMR